MRSHCLFSRQARSLTIRCLKPQRRGLLTLAIETSCDDTSVAILEKHKNNTASLHFNAKITSDNRGFQGIHPILGHESHQKNLAKLVKEALQSLPIQRSAIAHFGNALLVPNQYGAELRKKPDFVSVTRGPGMRASLITGVDTAKGLAVAWQVPYLGVNHMQAHALTPRMVSALESKDKIEETATFENDPAYPFLSLLASGGHTMLVLSRDLCDHEIIATSTDTAVGHVIDKAAREVLPASIVSSAENVMYGPLLERYAFPEPTYNYKPPRGSLIPKTPPNEFGWSIVPPFLNPGEGGIGAVSGFYSFSGIGTQARNVLQKNPNMGDVERRLLAEQVMRTSFEHLASRVILALKSPKLKDVNTLVVSGGVASNQYLKHILRSILDFRGYENIRLMFPPPKFCTDNAAMIAWTGLEMWEAGWRSELEAMATSKWSIDPRAEDGGILGIGGWSREKPRQTDINTK